MQRTRPLSLKGQTILITGGSSGIGLELARCLAPENTVLICGRSQERIESAMRVAPGIHAMACDLAVPAERERLKQWVATEHPACSILINNAAIVHRTSFRSDPQIMQKMELEFQTNCLAPIGLTNLFLPMLERNAGAAIYVTTGLVYAPKAAYPAYNATKAALHSFAQGLRLQLHREKAPLLVIEVLMPAVDTPWHEGNPPGIAIPVERAVKAMLAGMKTGNPEVRVAGTKALYAV